MPYDPLGDMISHQSNNFSDHESGDEQNYPTSPAENFDDGTGVGDDDTEGEMRRIEQGFAKVQVEDDEGHAVAGDNGEVGDNQYDDGDCARGRGGNAEGLCNEPDAYGDGEGDGDNEDDQEDDGYNTDEDLDHVGMYVGDGQGRIRALGSVIRGP